LPGSVLVNQGACVFKLSKNKLLIHLLIENKYVYPRRRTPMSTLRNISLDLQLGQTILVGKNAEPAEITKIEYHPRTGEIMLNTTRGPRRALTFRLVEQEFDNPAEKYR
jgi:phage antirepressor YoqD-like protein